MSPKGLKAPPAFAATTILIQPSDKNLPFPLPQASRIEHITKAAVKLSAIGDKKKVIMPVNINNCLKLNPFDINLYLITSKTFLS